MTRTAALIYVSVVDRAGNKARVVDQSARIEGIEYHDLANKVDTCTLTVDNFDLANFDSPLWLHGNHVQVSWGYPGRMAIGRELIITKVTGFTDLKVVCKAKSVLLDAVKKSRTFRNMTRAEVVRQIAREYGFDNEALIVDDSDRKFPHITQAGVSDAQLIRKLADQEGWDFYVDQAGFHFHETRLQQQPVRTFEWFTDPGQGDVLKINLEADSTRKATAVKTKARDPIAKTTTESTASNATDTTRQGLGETLIVPSADLSSAAFVTTQAKPAPIANTLQSTTAEAERILLDREVGRQELARQEAAEKALLEAELIEKTMPFLPPAQVEAYVSAYPEAATALPPRVNPAAGPDPVTTAPLTQDEVNENEARIGYYRALVQREQTFAADAVRKPLTPDDPSLQDPRLLPRPEPGRPLTPDDPALQGSGYGIVYAPATATTAAGTDPKAAEAEAKKKFRKAALSAIKLDLEALGDPSMNAKTLVFLTGVGRRLTGNYFVKECIHSVKAGNYTMKLKLTSDGLGALPAKVDPTKGHGLPDVAGSGARSKAQLPEHKMDPAKEKWNDASVIAGKEVSPDALVPVPIYDKDGRQIGTTWRERGSAEPPARPKKPQQTVISAEGKITVEDVPDAPARPSKT